MKFFFFVCSVLEFYGRSGWLQRESLPCPRLRCWRIHCSNGVLLSVLPFLRSLAMIDIDELFGAWLQIFLWCEWTLLKIYLRKLLMVLSLRYVTLYNLCSKVWGEGDIMIYVRGYDECERIWWMREDIMSARGYHKYIGKCSVHQGDTIVYVGDIMSTSKDVQCIEGIFWFMWGISCVHRGMFSTSGDIMSTSEGYHKYIGGARFMWEG